MAKMIEGVVRDWLQSRREELNARFQLLQRRYPRLKSDLVLKCTSEILPPLGGNNEPGTSELLDAVYDLILLHCARGLLGDPETTALDGQTAPLALLMRQAFPALRPLLLARPQALPGSLSNAVENLGGRGPEFVTAIAEISTVLENADQLLDSGAVLAWRLGEARLRISALEAAKRLPAKAVLKILGIRAWPDNAAPLLLAALAADAWRPPQSLFTQKALDALASATASQLAAIRSDLSDSPKGPLVSWQQCGRIGNFSGFGGQFDDVPQLLDAGERESRHLFWVRCGTTVYKVNADLFGWVCKHDSTADFPVQSTTPQKTLWQSIGLSGSAGPAVRPDGTFNHLAQSLKMKCLEGTTSFVALDNILFYVLTDSFRIRVLAPLRPPRDIHIGLP